MKPCTPETIRARDRVVVDGWVGTVAFCSRTDSYGKDFSRSDWPKQDYSGPMICHPGGALVFYPSEHFIGEGGLSLCWEGHLPMWLE